MPSYFYHLLFELHPPSSPAAASLPELLRLPPATLSSLPFHRPKASIFTAALPAHDPALIPPPPKPAKPNHTRSKSLGKLKAPPPTPASDRRDWRFGRISVQSIDMTPVPAATLKDDGAAAEIGAAAAAKARFIPLGSKNTEFGYGVVHLYRDNYETPGLHSGRGPAVEGDQDWERTEGEEGEERDEPMTTVAVLAVPSYMTASDFMGFVGEKTRDNVSHFRMIRTGQVNRYMVLMKFRSQGAAAEFMKEFNGKIFNTMEPENCHVVYVKSIQFDTPASTSTTRAGVFPTLTNDPFSPSSTPAPASSTSPSASTSVLTTKPAPPPTPSLLELPTCPVCLERMDETTGLLTILCQHVFHCSCLSKWRDSSCPVCRYTQPGRSLGSGSLSADVDPCHTCGATSNLWICLLCGNVGCGRYDSAHAFEHFKETAHCYAMDIESSRVWDYAGDNYVHRLIQNKADGKLVEMPYSHAGGGGGINDGGKKSEELGMEYTYLLTSQLDSQRLYYEEKVAQAADKASRAAAAAEKASAAAEKLSGEVGDLRETLARTAEAVKEMQKEKERAEARATKATELARKITTELTEERGVNRGLMERIEWLTAEGEKRKEEAKGKEREITELQEQIRDLMFFVEAREKMKDADEDLAGGTVSLPDPPKEEGKKRKGKGRK